MPKDYYLVLGIASDATQNDIKGAYRRLAKAFHPDHCGEGHSRFLAIQEAYAVLSDPVKRQAHDSAVLGQKKLRQPWYKEGIRPNLRRDVEPLIPEHGAWTGPGHGAFHLRTGDFPKRRTICRVRVVFRPDL